MLRAIVTVLVVIMNIIGTLLPVYIGWSRLGMVDTYYPLIVPAFLGGGTFNIVLMRQFFLTISHELG